MALVASCEGGAHVAVEAFRQRSASDARMLTTTVRLRGWSGELVLKSLAWCRCCSWSAASPAAGAAVGAAPPAWFIAAAAIIWSAGMVRVD